MRLLLPFLLLLAACDSKAPRKTPGKLGDAPSEPAAIVGCKRQRNGLHATDVGYGCSGFVHAHHKG